MTLQVEFWELVGLAVTLFMGVIGAFIAVGKVMFNQLQQHIDMRISAMEAASDAGDQHIGQRLDIIEAARREDAEQRQRMERELYQLKIDLPQRYVQREDYVRGQTLVEAKLDALAAKLDSVQLRAAMALRPS